ncbi:MAG TPA: hypothetical protein VK095_05195 [Beutenbergiaceae bacterium]|nr:hypothetical protein [Beutenbergiaceae bacterium]
MRTSRIVTAGVIALGAAAMFTGCTTTQYNCLNQSCTVTLSGSGANTDPAGYTVELEGADGQQATFAINGESATCTEGEAVQVGGYSATCTEVGDDRLVVDID